MAASTVTTSITGSLVPVYLNKVFRSTLRDNLVLHQFGHMGQIPSGNGVVATWLQLKDMPVGATLTEGTDATAIQMSSTIVSATVVPKGQVVRVSDIAQRGSVTSTMSEIMEHMGFNAALTLDTQIRDSVFSAGGSATFGGTAVALNSIADNSSFDLNANTIRQAVAGLENALVPPHPKASDGSKYIAIVSPNAKYDLMGSSTWTNTVIYTEKMIDLSKMNKLGVNLGCSFYETAQALTMTNSGSASTDVVQTYVFGGEYFGITDFANLETVVKNPSPTSDLNQYATIGYKYTTAIKELDSARMINLQTSVSLETRAA